MSRAHKEDWHDSSAVGGIKVAVNSRQQQFTRYSDSVGGLDPQACGGVSGYMQLGRGRRWHVRSWRRDYQGIYKVCKTLCYIFNFSKFMKAE